MVAAREMAARILSFLSRGKHYPSYSTNFLGLSLDWRLMGSRLHKIESHGGESPQLLVDLYQTAFFAAETRCCYRRNGDVARWGLDLRIPLTQSRFLCPVVDMCLRHMKSHAITQVAATGVAGSLIAAGIVARADNVRCGILRTSRKRHGFRLLLEGKLASGVQTLFVDDILASGWTAERAIRQLRDEGVAVSRGFALFEFGWLTGRQRLRRIDVNFHSVATLTYNRDEAPRVVWERVPSNKRRR